MSKNNHPIRNEAKQILMNLGLSELEATDMEIGIFNSTLDYANSLKIQLSWNCQLFIDTYINKTRSLYSNLKSDCYINNNKLLERVKNKEFLPHEIAYMSYEDLYPEKWKDIIEKQSLRFKAAYEIKQIAMTDRIKCGKCKNNKISYYELQTRSGDESMTVYYNCIVCGNRWKN